MGTVTTTTTLEALRYPNESMIDYNPYDDLLYALKRTSTQLELFVSHDNGASWEDAFLGFTRGNIQETSGLFIDSEGNIHVLYRTYESGEDKVFYRRLRNNLPVWDAEKQVAAADAVSAGSVYTGLASVTFKLSNTWYHFYAIGTRNGTNSGVTLCAATTNSSNSWSLKNTLIDGYRTWLNGPDGVVHPALDFKHTGDGKSVGSGPALWVTWGRATQYCIKASWTSGPNWYGPWAPTNVYAGLTNQDHNTGRYNGYGDKYNIVVPAANSVTVIERKVDNSGALIRTCPNNHPQGAVTRVAITNHYANNNYRIYAVGTSTPDLYRVDYNAAAGTWGSWTIVSTADIVGATPTNFSARRNNWGNGQFDVLVEGGSSPYTITHTSSTLASAPHTPIIIGPANGAAKDVAQPLFISWKFTDDDPLDTQSAYALRRVIGGVTTYWNNGTLSWQGSEVFNSSGTTSKTLNVGWGADSDQPHNYSVKVKDQADLTSLSYSPAVQVIPSAKNNPTLTSPDPIVTTPTVVANWTVASQSAYKLDLEVVGLQVYSTGWVSATDLTRALEPSLTNGEIYTLKLTTRNAEGLQSDTVSKVFTVLFTAPHEPSAITLTPSSDLGGIFIEVDNGIPTDDEPPLVNQSIYRRAVGESGEGVRVATGISNNGTYFDFTVGSGIDYEYRILLYGVNGTTRLTDWLS